MAKYSTIYIAGHTGMVGSACWRLLEEQGYKNLIGHTSKELDLRDQYATDDFIKAHKPEVIIDAAAKVGGIWANNADPYGFLMDNMLIQNNLIRSAHKYDIARFIFLGSSCIYPKEAPQPLKEEYLLTGPLEPTNQWYALAKISGVKLIEALKSQYGRDYLALMPTNLYGPGDNYDLKTSHVLPALLRKFHEAKLNNHSPVTVWGSGKPLREFMHVDDLARAVLYSVENTLPDSLYNVGSGEEISIKDLALLIQNIVGHKGEIIWDNTKPDGTPRKLMDSKILTSLGWKVKINLELGVNNTYNDYVKR
ncbi:MAG: GDP-L-fucose synthase family protein [Flavobacteriaceae bacterium]